MRKHLPELLLALTLVFIITYRLKPKKSCSNNSIDNVATLISEHVPESIPEPVLRYGLVADSFYIEDARIKKHQNISEVLSSRGVSHTSIASLAKNLKPLFDVRKVRSGNKYSIFYTPDSARKAKYFVYENNPVDFFVCELDSDSMKVTPGTKEIVKKRFKVSGEITSSLWNTMNENSLNPTLAIKLSEIYAWTIDFFSIQKGDKFKIVYTEDFVEEKSVGISNIYAAHFTHANEDYFAFQFNQDEKDDYFDDKGQNLRKAFLKAPLRFSRISSRFSYSRMHPVLRIRRPHYGVDYAAPTGTPVYSIGDGTIVSKGYQKKGGGNYVKIKHNSVYSSVYMHLSRFGKGIKPGTKVKQKDVIGYVGATGLATGPHLDFRIYKNGSPVDPLKIKAPSVKPVQESNMPEFTAIKDSLMNKLALIPYIDNNITSFSIMPGTTAE